MQEGSFDVELTQIPVQRGGQMGDSPEQFQSGGWCCRFTIVDSIPLCKAFCNVADLVAYHLASIIALAFANEFPPQSTLASRDI